MHPADDKSTFTHEAYGLLRKHGWYRSTDGWRETSDRDRGYRRGLSEGEVVDELVRRDWVAAERGRGNGPVAGRFVLYEPTEGASVYVTSWDTWDEAAAAFPIEGTLILRDDFTGRAWRQGDAYEWEAGTATDERRSSCEKCGGEVGNRALSGRPRRFCVRCCTHADVIAIPTGDDMCADCGLMW